MNSLLQTRMIVCVLGTCGLLVTSGCTKKFSFEEIPTSITNDPTKQTDPDPGSTGDGRSYISESFSQSSGSAKLDVLFIDDNSPSMADEQGKLGARLASFTSELGNLDWQIGITTTDLSKGQFSTKGELLKFPDGSTVLSKNSADSDTQFLNTIVRPETNNCGSTCGSGDERPLEAAVLAIQKSDSADKTLFRPDADLAIVILSDEDEESTGKGVNPQDVIDAFNAKFAHTNKKLSSYGIIIQPGDTDCYNQELKDSQVYYGTFASTLAELTGGTTTSICDADYSDGLHKIAERVGRLATSVTLSQNVDPKTVSVVLTPAQNIPYHIEGSRVVFDRAPAPNSKIDVKYKKPMAGN